MGFEIRVYPQGREALAVRCDVCKQWIQESESSNGGRGPAGWIFSGRMADGTPSPLVYAHKACQTPAVRDLPWSMPLDVEIIYCLENMRPNMRKLRESARNLGDL